MNALGSMAGHSAPGMGYRHDFSSRMQMDRPDLVQHRQHLHMQGSGLEAEPRRDIEELCFLVYFVVGRVTSAYFAVPRDIMVSEILNLVSTPSR